MADGAVKILSIQPIILVDTNGAMYDSSNPLPVDAIIDPVDNRDTWDARIVPCIAKNTAYQGPNLTVPDSFALTIKHRVDVDIPGFIYVAESAAAVVSSANRVVLGKGEHISLKVKNYNDIFVAASEDGLIAELFSEV